MEKLIRITDDYFIKNSENSMHRFDLYERTITKENKKEFINPISYGISLAEAIKKVIYKMSSEDTETLSELLDKANALEEKIKKDFK